MGTHPFRGNDMGILTLFELASVTTPEAWVPALGDTAHGFPFLAGPGRLVVKDVIMMGAALVTMADSAKAYLAARTESRAMAGTSLRPAPNSS